MILTQTQPSLWSPLLHVLPEGRLMTINHIRVHAEDRPLFEELATNADAAFRNNSF